jgi:hypothetical protein
MADIIHLSNGCSVSCSMVAFVTARHTCRTGHRLMAETDATCRQQPSPRRAPLSSTRRPLRRGRRARAGRANLVPALRCRHECVIEAGTAPTRRRPPRRSFLRRLSTRLSGRRSVLTSIRVRGPSPSATHLHAAGGAAAGVDPAVRAIDGRVRLLASGNWATILTGDRTAARSGDRRRHDDGRPRARGPCHGSTTAAARQSKASVARRHGPHRLRRRAPGQLRRHPGGRSTMN